MDYYLNTENSYNRLVEEYQKYKSIVVAFDFDDTVYDFHKKGRIYKNTIQLLKDLKSINCYLICWTGQQDLNFVKTYLQKNDIPFDTINENPPFYTATSKKIYANAYLDDRAGLIQVYNELNALVKHFKGEEEINELELVSKKIHQLWMLWAKELIISEPNISQERRIRWETECFKDYEQLSEEMKTLDRKFAKEIINIKNK